MDIKEIEAGYKPIFNLFDIAQINTWQKYAKESQGCGDIPHGKGEPEGSPRAAGG